MLWDSNLPIQEYSDTHVYTTIYDQGSFKPVARLAWLRDDIPQPFNDEPAVIQDNPHMKVKAELKSKIEVYHYHNDQLGTPNELTNDKGEVVWLADYEAWGNTTQVIWHEAQVEALKVEKNYLQPIRFQGQYFDEETGLHYNRFRYYDPDMSMFISRDPIGLNGGDNVFAYAPNPTGFIDPLGLVTLDDAETSLAERNIKPRYRAQSYKSARYSTTQIFEEWLRLEKLDTSWLNEVRRDRRCPQNMNRCTGLMWEEIDTSSIGKAKVWVYHRGATFEVRSTPTVGGHTNQCTYDGQGNLIVNQIPAAGTADFRACPNPPLCPEHIAHDVDTYKMAEKFGREVDYYDVRPTIYEMW